MSSGRQQCDVRQGFPLKARHERLTAAADGESLDVVRRQIIEELDAIGPAHFDACSL